MFPLGGATVSLGCWIESGGYAADFERLLDHGSPRCCRMQRTHPGPQGPPGAPGPAATFRVVTGAGSVSCGDDELLVSLVCATRATDGVKCVAPDAAATGLCVRKWSFATSALTAVPQNGACSVGRAHRASTANCSSLD